MADESTTPAAGALLEHATFVRELCRGMLRDEHLAEDVAQDTLVAGFRRAPGPLRNPRGWLATVARNFARRAHRRSSGREERERTAARPEGVPSAADDAARLEAQRRVVSAVRDLPAPARAVVILRYLDGVGPAEIGRRLGVPVRTVESRLRRALADLRRRLAGDDPESSRSILLVLAGLRPTPVGATGWAAVTGGVAIMTMKSKLVLAAAAVLLLSGVMLPLLSGGGLREPAPIPETPSPPQDTPAGSRVAGRPAADAASENPAPATSARAAERMRGGCHGSIRFEDGVPVANVAVRLAIGTGGDDSRTDAEGHYRFVATGGMVEDVFLLLVSDKPPTTTLNLGEVHLRPGEDVTADFTIPGPFPVTVRVTGPDGKPRSGVLVTLAPQEGAPRGIAFGMSGADGLLEFPWLGAGPCFVRADPAGFRPFRAGLEPPRWPPGTEYPLTLGCAERLALVLAGWTETGPESFLLQLTPIGPEPPGGPFFYSGDISPDGTWEGSAPPGGSYKVWLSVAGRMLTQDRLEVPETGPAEIRFAAPTGVEVRGRLLTANGDPVSGGRVFLSSASPPPLHLSGQTEQDGEFRLGNARPGRYQVSGQQGDMTFSDLVPEGLEVGLAGLTGVVLRLPQTGTASVSGLLIGFSGGSTAALVRRVQVLREGPDGFKHFGAARVNAVGDFHVGGLPAGRYRLEVAALPAMRVEGTGATEVMLAEGEDLRDVRIRSEERAGIELVLGRPSGEPFTEPATVAAQAKDRESSELLLLRPDSEGRCPVSSLSPGRWTLTFLGGPDRSKVVEIEVPERPGGHVAIVLW